MDENIKVILEGAEGDDGHVDLKTFLKKLDVVQSALSKIDRCVYGTNQPSTRFLVTDLTHSSPAVLQIEPRYKGQHIDRTEEVVKRFDEVVGAATRGEIPENVDYSLLELLQPLGPGVKNTPISTTVVVGNTDYDIDKTFSLNIANALERGETCIGSVEGPLEQINLHGKVKHFTIYPKIGPSKVKCNFPEELHDEAINSIEKNVAVTGKLYYRPRSPYPHKIDVQFLDVNPKDEDLPDFNDLLGIAPATDGVLPSEEAIREVRDEWH